MPLNTIKQPAKFKYGVTLIQKFRHVMIVDKVACSYSKSSTLALLPCCSKMIHYYHLTSKFFFVNVEPKNSENKFDIPKSLPKEFHVTETKVLFPLVEASTKAVSPLSLENIYSLLSQDGRCVKKNRYVCFIGMDVQLLGYE